MKRRLILICTSFLIILGMYVVSTATASAATIPSQKNILPFTTVQQSEHAISLLKPHIHIDAQKRVSFDVNNGASIGLNEQTFDFFKQGATQYNTALNKGLFKTSHATNVSSIVHPYSCAGRSGNVGRNPYTLYLNECDTVKIEALLLAGSAIGTIAAIIVGLIPGGQPIAIAIGIIAALAALGAAVMLYIDASGGFNGLYVNWQRLPPPSGLHVWGIGHQ